MPKKRKLTALTRSHAIRELHGTIEQIMAPLLVPRFTSSIQTHQTRVTLEPKCLKNMLYTNFWKNGGWHHTNISRSQCSQFFGNNTFPKGVKIFGVFFTFRTCLLFLGDTSEWLQHMGLKACVLRSCADFNAVQ